jgi:hypothetical protein
MPGHYPNQPLDSEGQLGLVVANLFREEGWKVLNQHREAGTAPDLIASLLGKKLVVEIKRASEGRKDRVIPLLSQAALEASYYSQNLAGRPIPVAIVGANHMPESVAEEAKRFLQERAPDVAVGLVDLEGFRLFAGHGLESLNSPRRSEKHIRAPKLRAGAPQLFSDLNQWMLKVLVAPRIPESLLSAPRGHYQGASQLAAAAGVSVMSAFRFVEELSKEGFLESGEGSLRLVRLRELLNRWQAASQRRVLEVPMRWVLHRGEKALRSALRSYQSKETISARDSDGLVSSLRPRVCIGLFEAAEALGIGFVRGVQPYIYVERLNAAVLQGLGLSENAEGQVADIYVRVPGNRESVFRGLVEKNGVPVCDILQVWLDVGQHPARGKEQAEVIWRKILAPAFESYQR